MGSAFRLAGAALTFSAGAALAFYRPRPEKIRPPKKKKIKKHTAGAATAGLDTTGAFLGAAAFALALAFFAEGNQL